MLAAENGSLNQQQLGSWLSSAFGQLHNGEFEIGLQQLVHAQRRTPLKPSHSRDEMLRHSALQARALYQEAIVNSAQVSKLHDPIQEQQAQQTEQVTLTLTQQTEQVTLTLTLTQQTEQVTTACRLCTLRPAQTLYIAGRIR